MKAHAEALRAQRGVAATKWPQKTRKVTKGFVSTTLDTKNTKNIVDSADLGVLRVLGGYQEFAHAARILNVCSAEVNDQCQLSLTSSAPLRHCVGFFAFDGTRITLWLRPTAALCLSVFFVAI